MYSYKEIFQRNIGIFTEEEQQRIKDLTVAIVGAGGIGGAVASLIARLGVGEIRIADPETFEVSNLNRQFGAYIDTIGLNKAQVLGDDLLRINPYLSIASWPYGINDENVEEFLADADIVVDAIDFYCIENELALHEQARMNGQWVFVSQMAGSMVSFINFKPQGMSFKDLFFKDGVADLEALIKGFFPVLPQEAFTEMGVRIISGEQKILPVWSHAPFATALFLVEDIVKFAIKDTDILEAPDLYQLDLSNMKFINYKNGVVQSA